MATLSFSDSARSGEKLGKQGSSASGLLKPGILPPARQEWQQAGAGSSVELIRREKMQCHRLGQEVKSLLSFPTAFTH